MNIGNRLQIARKDRGISQTELAKLVNATQQTIQFIEDGTTKKSKYLPDLAKVLDISYDWLIEGKGEMGAQKSQTIASLVKLTSDTVKIPLLSAKLSMGKGLPADLEHDEEIKSIELTKRWVNSRLSSASSIENIKLVTGMGDSMKGTFNHGDLLFIDTGITDLKVDAVYAVRHDDQLWIKRIQRIPGGRVKMISDNRRKYPDPIVVEHKYMEDFQVIGRVIGSLNFGEI